MRFVIRERFFAIGNDSDIMDESGQPVLQVDGKVFTLRDKLVVKNLSGQEVATVQRKMLSFRPTYEISIGGQEAAEVRKHFFTPFRDKFTIDIPGPDDLEMSGNIWDHEFTITQGNRQVAQVSKQWFSWEDTYGVDIAPDVDELLILTSVLALDLAQHEERESR